MFVVNWWSDVCWVLPCKRERQRIRKGRLDGLGVELSWVWLACRGFDWGRAGRGGAGRKVMVEYSWKGKREKKRQSWVGNGFMTFFFFFWGFGFIIFLLIPCWRRKLWEFQKFRLYIYIYYILEHPISITHPIQTGFYRVSLPFIKLHDQQGQERE